MRSLSLMAAVVAGLSAPAHAQTAYIGQIQYFPYGGTSTAVGWCPYGWLLANGQAVSITTYTTLFDVLGTSYGGNGTTSFKVPNMKPVLTVNHIYLTPCIAYLGVFPSRG